MYKFSCAKIEGIQENVIAIKLKKKNDQIINCNLNVKYKNYFKTSRSF